MMMMVPILGPKKPAFCCCRSTVTGFQRRQLGQLVLLEQVIGLERVSGAGSGAAAVSGGIRLCCTRTPRRGSAAVADTGSKAMGDDQHHNGKQGLRESLHDAAPLCLPGEK
jgi:hypothetical protein